MYYIGYYTTADDVRVSSPAANTKMVSVAEALAANGNKVNIVSTCLVAQQKGYIKGRKFEIIPNVKCRQYSFWCTERRLIKKLQYVLMNIRLFLLLVFTTKKNDNVLVYHAIERSLPILLAKKMKGFRLVLEVEELYADALPLSEREKRVEKEIISKADAYVFPTVLLNERLNSLNRPYTIIHGTYKVEAERDENFDDNKIHVVYAGTLDCIKGGALAAVDCAKYLSEAYFIHILGFGTSNEVEQIQKKIMFEKKQCKCGIAYEGCLKGDDYISFIQKCHIGLSTQNPNADFNDTSFPSKILSYMANGLQVVCVRIPVVETSKIGEYVHYYEEQNSEQIAQAIKSVGMTYPEEIRNIIKNLNNKFIKDIDVLCKNK